MPKVELKAPVIEEIASCVKDAKSAILVDYRGLTVAEDTALRRQLREANVTYKVYKNTYMKRAFEGTDFAQMDSLLDGPSALAVTKDEDIAAPARIIAEFAKKAQALEIKGGVVEGQFYDAAGVSEIAKIPSREVLLSRLLGSMQSPITNFARVIKQIAEKKAEGGEGAAAEEPAKEEAPAEAAPEQEPAKKEASTEAAPEAADAGEASDKGE
ncbi:MAG: 50S ribosomal protein L10 [Lachnospiraceae bacterium]|nr:50S ribosomal protein L10 [Lachnospiraceae bacterium]